MRNQRSLFVNIALSAAVLTVISVIPAYSQKAIGNGQSMIDRSKSGTIKSTSPDVQPQSTGIGVGAQLSAIVDEDVCRTGAIQCSTEGHTAASAAQTNHNPVAISIQVLNATGAPILGLPTTAFTVSTEFVPAGGAAVQRLTGAPSDFQATPNGVYRLFVHPAPEKVNWKSGRFVIQVRVAVVSTTDRLDGRVIVPIEIPF